MNINEKLAVAQVVCDCNSKVVICVHCIQNKVATHPLSNNKIILKYVGLHFAGLLDRHKIEKQPIIVKLCTLTFDLTISFFQNLR